MFLMISLHIGISSIYVVLLLRIGCINAAKKLHEILLIGILHAPLSYFDQTPIGRILSRFSFDEVDTEIPALLDELLYCAFEVIFHKNNDREHSTFVEN